MKAVQSPSLICRGLRAGYGESEVLGGLDFELPPGASLAVLGPSGCGKSTLLSVLAGSYPLLGGEICWSIGEEARPLSSLRTSFVWQNLGLYPWKRVAENLSLPLAFMNGLSAEERERRTSEMLSELRLTGLEKRFISELSGGQRQRLALGRALIVKPEVLFLDEPFSALDAMLREHLQNFLIGLRKRHPCTSVFVTHDVAEAVKLGSHILILRNDSRKDALFFENPAFCREKSFSDRENPLYFETVKRVYADIKSEFSEEDR